MLARMTWTLMILCCGATFAHAETIDLAPQLAKLRAVGPKGAGHREASEAWRIVATADARQLPDVLAGMKGAGALSNNWFRAAVETIADKQTSNGGELPVKALEQFLLDTSQAPRARRLAFELVYSVDPTVKQRIIPTLRNDPSLELRRDAIAMALIKAESLLKKDKAAAITAYREALSAARDVDQIKAAAAKLQGLDATTDLPTHFGFVMKWRLIGPFDNRDDRGYDKAYPPEENVDLTASYEGMNQKVKWISHETKHQFGLVDLTKALDKHKGAVCYAYATFTADKARDVELRLGCINANKIWLNGQPLSANHVYHSGSAIDQYVGKGRLKQGENAILLKICQNEQEDNWAQKWEFQLRVCDSIGTAVLSRDRVLPRTTALPRILR